VAADAAAYQRRDAPYLVTAEATWENDGNINGRDAVVAMQSFSRLGFT